MEICNCEYRSNQRGSGALGNLEAPQIQRTDEYAVHYVIEGGGFFRINGDRLPLQHDSVFVTFPEDSYSFFLPKLDVSFAYYALTFRLHEADHQIRRLLDDEVRGNRAIRPKKHMRSVFDELIHNYLSESPLLTRANEHLVVSLLYTLLSEEREFVATAQAAAYVEKAIDWMHGHIQDSVTLHDLCKNLNVTEAHFIRLFKGSQGIPPMKYFMRLKIDSAANLLLETTTPVYAISEMLGFSSAGHFCRTFKQYLGVAPLHYRQNNTQSIESKKRKYQQHLEEAYSLLQTIMDASPDLIFFKDVNSVYMGCNEAFSVFTGLSKHQIIGRSDFDIHPRDKAEFFTRRDRLIFQNNRAIKNEEELTFPNDRTRLYQVHKAPFHDARGRVIGLIGISRDITDLKKHNTPASFQDFAGPVAVTSRAQINSV